MRCRRNQHKAGGALGTKPTAIVFVPPLLALVMAGIVLGRGDARRRLADVAIVAIAPMATGGYWFVRNVWRTGNPLYPLDVRILGRTLWDGWYGPDAMRTSPYYLPMYELGALADTVLALLDPRMAPVWLAAVAGAWARSGSAARFLIRSATSSTWPIPEKTDRKACAGASLTRSATCCEMRMMIFSLWRVR